MGGVSSEPKGRDSARREKGNAYLLDLNMNIRKIVRSLLSLLIITIGGGIITSLINNYLSKNTKVNESFRPILRWFVNNFFIILLLIVIIVVLNIFLSIKEKEKLFTMRWEIIKKSSRISWEDLNIQRYSDAFISRPGDLKVKNLVINEKNVLIIGKPKIGKTRSAYEAIKLLKNIYVLKPRPNIDIERNVQFGYPYLIKRRTILCFFDDIERFAEIDLNSFISSLRKKCKKLLILGTCRTGEELNDVKHRFLTLIRDLTQVELEQISSSDGELLANSAGLQWKPNQFDGTPGSITLDLMDMRERYIKLGKEKAILKTLKLMKEAGLYFYNVHRVQKLGQYIWFSNDHINRQTWDERINVLKTNGFISIANNTFDIYPSYLDYCVDDYDPIEHFQVLEEFLVRENDSGSLCYLGQKYIQKKDYEKAKDCFNAAIRIYPKYVKGYNALGFTISKKGQAEESKGKIIEAETLYKEAVQVYKKGIAYNSRYSILHANLGYTLTNLGEIYGDKGDKAESKLFYAEALKEQQKAVALNPEFAAGFRYLGYLYGCLGEEAESIKNFETSISLDPDSAYAHNLYGFQLASLRKSKEAEAEFLKAIELKPDYPSAHNHLGHLFSKEGRFNEAEAEYRESLRYDPNYSLAYHNLGTLYRLRKEYPRAVHEISEALKRNPRYYNARISLGITLKEMQKYSDAEVEFRKAIEINPKIPDAYINLADALIAQGDEFIKNGNESSGKKKYLLVLELAPFLKKMRITAEVNGIFLKLVQRLPTDPEVFKACENYLPIKKEAKNDHPSIEPNKIVSSKMRSRGGRDLLRSGRYEEAEKELVDAVNANPRSAECHKNLGVLWETKSNNVKNNAERKKLLVKAEKEFKKALEFDENHPSARRHLANVFARQKRNKDAEGEFRKNLEISKNYPKNNRDFGVFLKKQGKKEEAKEQLEIALKIFTERDNRQQIEEIRKIIDELK